MIVAVYRVSLFGFGFLLCSYFGRLFVYLLIAAYSGVDYEVIVRVVELNADNKWVILGANAGSSVGAFVIWPVLYSLYFEGGSELKRMVQYKGDRSVLLCVVVLFVCLLVFNSLFIDLLYSLPVPRGLEGWYGDSIERYETLKRALFCFADVGSVYELFVVVCCLCVVPAVGEELLFRGILQHKLCGALGKDRISIFLVSLLFAVMHFDWFGFIPRVLLSVFLGYVYIVCGDVRVSMFFHFANNLLAVMYAYFKVKGII